MCHSEYFCFLLTIMFLCILPEQEHTGLTVSVQSLKATRLSPAASELGEARLCSV